MSKKLLLIEYEPRYLERIRGFLEGKDYELVIARDGEEGLEACRRSMPDVILVSSVLPKLRTPDVIKGVHELGTPPPILLLMAGYRGKNRVADARRVGATSILEKPFTEESFLAELEAVSRVGSPGFGAVPDAPLLSSDDIFSDVLSGMDEPKKPAAAPAPRAMSDVDRKLHDTLSGLMQPPRREAVQPADERTMRMETPAPAVRPEKAARRDTDVDRMLNQTLSDLKGGKPPEKVEKPAAPRPASSQIADLERGLLDRGRLPQSSSRPGSSPGVAVAPPPATSASRPSVPTPAPDAPGSGRGTGSGAPRNFGRYQLLEKIAAGGMAEVYKARMSGEEGFEKIVAIKRILPHMADSVDFITMFIDEAKLAAQLTHSNIIHIYDLGKVDAYHYIAMEYVDGKDLRSILKLGQERGWPLPPELSLFLASKVANALDYAHRRLGADGKELDLVHRDVSPQNILVSFEGDIKLCDFGIAKAATKMSQTQTGALKGKLQYMSPEQAWGRKVDRRSDIYSLGLVLHEMLTGDRLFTGDTDLAILEQVRDGQVAPPSSKNPDVSEKVDQIVLRALSKDPADRFQNASEFEKEINAVLYSYRPTPGPADLAIYMHRLSEASPIQSDEQIDAAFAMAEAAHGPETGSKAKKGKGLVISKKEPVAPAPRPAPEVEQPAPEAVQAAEPPKSKVGLFAGLGLAAVVVVAGGIYLTSGTGPKPPANAGPASPVAAGAPGTISSPAPAATTPQAAERIVDPKAVAEEAKRLGAIQAEELRKAAAQKGAVPTIPAKGAAAPVAADLSMNPSRPIQPPVRPEAQPPAQRPAEPTSRPTPEPPKVAEAIKPAAVVAAPAAPAPPPVIPAPSSGQVREGDLVGPGDGVVEPRLVRLGPFPALPPQARQMARQRGDGSLGSPTVHVLVSETGAVLETRVVRPSQYKFVDEAAVAALKAARIEPATKDGVHVKMWKAFTVGVKP